MEILIDGKVYQAEPDANGKVKVTFTKQNNSEIEIKPLANCQGTTLLDNIQIEKNSTPTAYEEPSLVIGESTGLIKDVRDVQYALNEPRNGVYSKITQLNNSISLKVSNRDLLSQINVQANGILIQSGTNKLNITPDTTYIENGTIKSAMIKSLEVDKITGTQAQFTTMITNGLTADVITSTMINADEALFNMLFSTTLATDRLAARTAWITNANIVSLDAGKIKTGTIDSGRINAGKIVTNGLSADVVKSTHIQSSTGLIDKIFADDAYIKRMTGKTAFISSIQAIDINASRITSGTLDASKITVSNLSASSLTTGTLDANKVTINNLSVGSLTGFDATFMRTKWNNATGGGVGVSDEGITSVASDNSQVLIQNGRTLYRNTVGATLGSMGYQDYGSSPYMTIQTSLGSHFRLSMRRDTLVGNSNDKHALSIMSGGYEMYLNTDNIYLTGDTTIQKGLSVYNNLSLSGGEINGTNRVKFAKGAYLEEQSTGNVQLRSAGTQLQFFQASGRIMYSEGTRLFLDLPINMQGNGVLNQSDARIKTDIRKIEQDSLSIIKGTDFVNYKMISNGRETFGFIAQQMQNVAPHLIKDEDGTLAFDSMEWTQTVAHGLQQLSSKVDENDNKVNNRIKELESKIEMLELELKRVRG